MTPSEHQEIVEELAKANERLGELNKTLNALLGFLFITTILFAVFK